jgi:hypothetical protein
MDETMFLIIESDNPVNALKWINEKDYPGICVFTETNCIACFC